MGKLGHYRLHNEPCSQCVQLRNGMSESAITVQHGWSRQQRNVARLMALGYKQTEAAEQTGTPLRTVQDWVAKGLDAFADELHERGWERLDPKFWGNIELALDLQNQVFRGEMASDDPRYLEARRWLDRALSRSTSFAAPKPGREAAQDGDSQPNSGTDTAA